SARDGISEKYRLSVSGGSEDKVWRVSGSFKNQDGFVKGNNYKNYRLATRFNQNITDKLSFGLDINLSRQKMTGPCQDGYYVNCIMSASSFTLPFTKPYLDDGSYSQSFPFLGGNNNPAIQLNERDRITNVFNLLGSFQLTYDVADWLNITGKASLDYHQQREKEWLSPIADPGNGGSINSDFNPVNNQQYNITANFAHTFNVVHDLSGVVGTEYRRNYEDYFYTRGIGLPNDIFDVLSATSEPTDASGSWAEYRRFGVFGKVNYTFKDRYVLNGTMRYDGDSRFRKDHRYGLFPAISAGWVVTEEDFFNVGFLNFLKLRAEWGASGNSQLDSYYASRSLFGVSSSYASAKGMRPIQLANPQLSWEENWTIGAGIDYGFFNNRIRGSIDYYNKKTSNLLLGKPLPTSSGWSSITKNIGDIVNEGVEFQIFTDNIRTSDFRSTSSFNISYNENEVTSLVGSEEALSSGSIQPVAVGHDIDAWKMY